MLRPPASPPNSHRDVAPPSLAPVAEWLQNGFHFFLQSYLRRHFDAVAISKTNRFEAAAFADQPLVIFANHPSWWDPLVAHFVNNQCFGPRQFRAPIDADALQQYQIFERLGFFGIQANSRAGAAAFIKIATAVMESNDDVLWITPEGRFADVRDHNAPLMPGLAHVCQRVGRGHAIPLAMEYVFWNERLPVCLLRFGAPINLSDLSLTTKSEVQIRMTDGLRSAQHALAAAAQKRSFAEFDHLVVGRSGGGVVYDTFRRLKSIVTGQRFRSRHEAES